MALESVQERIAGDQYPDGSAGGTYQSAKYVFTAADITLNINQSVCECDTTDNTIAVTLPNVEEAAGKFYSISLTTDVEDLTVQDQDESRDWTDIVMDTVDDYVLLYSDGRKWFILDSEIVP